MLHSINNNALENPTGLATYSIPYRKTSRNIANKIFSSNLHHNTFKRFILSADILEVVWKQNGDTLRWRSDEWLSNSILSKRENKWKYEFLWWIAWKLESFLGSIPSFIIFYKYEGINLYLDVISLR